MKTIGTPGSFGLWLAVTLLAGCGGSQPGSRVAGVLPSSINDFTAASPAGHGKVVPVCTDKRPGHAQCFALVLNGRPIADGGSGPLGGFTPAQLQAAYNLPSSTQGTGQIVAIVDAYDNPNVASDLAYYRSYFGLSPANFYKYNQEGQQGNYPTGNKGWGDEIDLDVEMVSASCPNCTIYLVEANSNGADDLDAAEAEAVALGAHIVSNSWGGICPPYCFEQSYFDTPGVVYLAAAGDFGYAVYYPMAFGNVVSVGGTHLVQGGGKRGWTETVWGGAGFAPWGTGGGCSDQPKPSWQHDPGCQFRTANDVAAIADPFTGVSQYNTYDGFAGWDIDGGTSIATPLLAGVFALAGNATSQNGGETFWKKKHQSPNDLNPVLRGSNGHCAPTYLCIDGTHQYKDYGGPTGWGTPNGVGAF